MGCLKLLHNELHIAQESENLQVVYRKPKQNSHYRYLHRDHLGSILAITDDSGNLLEQRHFDAWGSISSFKKNGQETDFRDTILNRGFTGHEHFEQVRLIHMNGRMYDSRLHHFLGPDNFIQDPYNTMSYDRRTYVWNNPLMNSDPTGELVWFAAIMGAFFGATNAMMNDGNILLGTLIGGIAGFVGAGVGNLAAGGTFLGSGALSATGFSAGFTVGFTGGFAGGFVGATLTGLAAGQNIGEALGSGIKAGFVGGVIGGITAGIGAGVKAKKAGGDFWSGKGTNSKRWVETFEKIKMKGVQSSELELSTDWDGQLPYQREVLNSPVGDATISSPFGVDRATGTSPHRGTDYAVPTGTQVQSTASGVIARAYNSDTYGNTLIINHGVSPQGGGNVYTLYAHGDSVNVAVGDVVNLGDTVMFSGNTGTQSFGPHLHYEVIRTNLSPFSQQFFSDFSIRYSPSELLNLLRN